jgi:HD-GYP domain-containing protein (c-di-GMP phosphodiesterase class II)
MKLLRLCVQHIRLHEPLPWNVRTEAEHLLLGKGFVLTDQGQIDALLERGVYVDLDEYEEHQRALQQALARPNPFALWADIRKRASLLLRNPRGSPNFSQDLGQLSSLLHGAMKQDVCAGTFEIVSGDANGYSVFHAVQTAFVATLAAERFGWSSEQIATLIRAALTMNIAMLDLQNTLVQQKAPLTPQQRADIVAHPARGRAMLEAAGVTDTDWLNAVENHHVTRDGSELPLERGEACDLACLIHYADVYLAKLSARANRPSIAVNVAARDLFLRGGGNSNPFAAAIIKQMGIYPPGSFVKLANGDTAVVVRPGDTANTPFVHSLISADGWVYPDTKAVDTSAPTHKVVMAVPSSNVLVRINRNRLFDYPEH